MCAGADVPQSLSQAPQSETLVLRFVSQPLTPPPSQFPKPGSQLWPHAPLTHAGEALFQSSGQDVEQLPQCATSASVFVSHPLRLTFSSAEQSLQPASQLEMLQVLLAHDEVAWFELQAALHPPQ